MVQVAEMIEPHTPNLHIILTCLKIDWITIGNIKTLYMIFRHRYKEAETEVIFLNVIYILF